VITHRVAKIDYDEQPKVVMTKVINIEDEIVKRVEKQKDEFVKNNLLEIKDKLQTIKVVLQDDG
jgi:hypothetical protein